MVRKSEFVDFLAQDLSGFVNAFEQRINEHHEIVLKGEAEVVRLTRGEILDDGMLNRLLLPD